MATPLLTTAVCLRAPCSMLTGLLAQWLFVSRFFTLTQGMLTRRLIQDIEEDMRYSRGGYETYFKGTPAHFITGLCS